MCTNNLTLSTSVLKLKFCCDASPLVGTRFMTCALNADELVVSECEVVVTGAVASDSSAE